MIRSYWLPGGCANKSPANTRILPGHGLSFTFRRHCFTAFSSISMASISSVVCWTSIRLRSPVPVPISRPRKTAEFGIGAYLATHAPNRQASVQTFMAASSWWTVNCLNLKYVLATIGFSCHLPAGPGCWDQIIRSKIFSLVFVVGCNGDHGCIVGTVLKIGVPSIPLEFLSVFPKNLS